MTEQAKTDTAQTHLVVIEPTTAVALFTEGQGVAELLADIRQKATSLVPDTTTAKGRKEIASIAHAVARTINNAILMDLMGLGIEEGKAINLIKHIASNKIDHLTINY